MVDAMADQPDQIYLTLHESLQGERDFKKRLSALTKHFEMWYEATHRVPVRKVGKGYSKSKSRTVKSMT